MEKIQTIFQRDWDGDRGVIDEFVDNNIPELLASATATEKLDGTNIRVTVRKTNVVRVEKRRNPNKVQKQQGIKEPWYVDADEYSPEDKWIFDGVRNTDFKDIPDGEWSGELVGKNIQGNPLNLENNRIVLFSLGLAPVFEDVPTCFDGLKHWLPKLKSKYGNNCGIEGIVWHCENGQMFKIKNKDFK